MRTAGVGMQLASYTGGGRGRGLQAGRGERVTAKRRETAERAGLACSCPPPPARQIKFLLLPFNGGTSRKSGFYIYTALHHAQELEEANARDPDPEARP